MKAAKIEFADTDAVYLSGLKRRWGCRDLSQVLARVIAHHRLHGQKAAAEEIKRVADKLKAVGTPAKTPAEAAIDRIFGGLGRKP